MCALVVLQRLYDHGYKDAVTYSSETVNASVDVKLFQGDKAGKLHPLTPSRGMAIVSW